MNIADIESQLRDLVEQPFDAAEFPFAFLTIYDAAKATVTKLRQGAANQARVKGDVLLKNKLFFRPATAGGAAKALDEIAGDALTERHKPRFLIATDGTEVYARDLKADQTLDISFAKLNDAFDFFLPLAGFERHEGIAENPADIKATGRLAKLYDAILEGNPDWLEAHGTHELNLFMTRMLFCFFAEDTSIFPDGAFTSAAMSLTAEDGHDTSSTLTLLFKAMNTPMEDRVGLPQFTRPFPYVNGGLFREDAAIPNFSKRARRLLGECGDLKWKDINPDIFGSMIQAVVEPGLRSDMGMHYTSVPNIMKVIGPLFINSLEEEFDSSRDSEVKLNKLLQRIYNIRVFDPACGSGNFLIIAYRELRRLETRIFQRQRDLAKQGALAMSGVRLSQFFGIELADFAAETAKLSLWIAEYQLNAQFKDLFGSAPPALPLRESGAIHQGNALLADWSSICPPNTDRETYVVGNPPFLGARKQTPAQKADLESVFEGHIEFKDTDYVAGWFLRASEYINGARAEAAFVATSSISQGEQVAYIWRRILARQQEIGFAYSPFKWANNAANNAGVYCVVIGFRNTSGRAKWIFNDAHSRRVSNISPYIIEGPSILVERARAPVFPAIPRMVMGNMARDGGNLILSKGQRDAILQRYPTAARIIKRLMGSDEFMNGSERWCLWLEDGDLDELGEIPEIATRIAAVRKFRLDSTAKTTNGYATISHKFAQRCHADGEAIVVPSVAANSSGYLAVGFVDSDVVVTNLAFVVYDAEPHIFGLLSSRLHALWAETVSGRLGVGVRYSANISYNTFPVPRLSNEQRLALSERAVAILQERESNPGKTISWMYDGKTMPKGLLDAHREIDEILEPIYLGRSFKNDAERLATLFKHYATHFQRDARPPARSIPVSEII